MPPRKQFIVDNADVIFDRSKDPIPDRPISKLPLMGGVSEADWGRGLRAMVAGYSISLPSQSVFGGQLFRQRVLRYIIRISSGAPPPIISGTTTTSSALTRAA